MARNVDNSLGDLERWIDCPECDFEGVVYYNRKPPEYCSDKCKQKAYRRRKAGSQVAQSIPIDLDVSDYLVQKIKSFAGEYGLQAGQELLKIVKRAKWENEAKWLNRNSLGVTYLPEATENQHSNKTN